MMGVSPDALFDRRIEPGVLGVEVRLKRFSELHEPVSEVFDCLQVLVGFFLGLVDRQNALLVVGIAPRL